jgi:hypothetical protein
MGNMMMMMVASSMSVAHLRSNRKAYPADETWQVRFIAYATPVPPL